MTVTERDICEESKDGMVLTPIKEYKNVLNNSNAVIEVFAEDPNDAMTQLLMVLGEKKWKFDLHKKKYQATIKIFNLSEEEEF